MFHDQPQEIIFNKIIAFLNVLKTRVLWKDNTKACEYEGERWVSLMNLVTI